MKLLVDRARCTGCGLCTEVCPQQILALDGGALQVLDIDRCMGCFGCEDECPTGAVRLLRAPQGLAQIEIEPPLDVTRCDVAVVGAGPAGLGAAIACARGGLEVVVLERLPNRTLSHHPDGGVLFTLPWMTSMRVEASRLTFPELEISLDGGFLRPCRVLGFLGPDGLGTGSEVPPSMEGWTGSKDRFVEALVGEAEAAGARIWYNARVIDLLWADGRAAGVRLDGGVEIEARAVVTADGAFARISEKAGMEISHNDLWYAALLALEYENRAGLPAGLYYLQGDLPFDGELSGALGGVAVSDVIHVMAGSFFRRPAYPAPRPLDWYATRLLESEPRLGALLGDALRDQAPRLLNGCRALCRARPNVDPVGEGVLSVGDAWVDDGELGNVPALAHGVYAGRVLVEAARQDDFSRAALAPARAFIDRRLLRALAENKRMKLLGAELDEEEMRQMFQFMQHLNYPTLLLGSPRQQSRMFTRFLLKNLFRFVRYPRIARLFF